MRDGFIDAFNIYDTIDEQKLPQLIARWDDLLLIGWLCIDRVAKVGPFGERDFDLK